MNLRFVEAFYWVASLKSVTRAAEKLFLTQSAMSSRIAALEEELGVLLQVRTSERDAVMALLREGLQGATRTRHVEEIRGEFVAIDTALSRLQPGDLCLVLVDQVEEALAHLARCCEPSAGATA